MAEIRIPTDQIPVDILHRLQAMIPSFKASISQATNGVTLTSISLASSGVTVTQSTPGISPTSVTSNNTSPQLSSTSAQRTATTEMTTSSPSHRIFSPRPWSSNWTSPSQMVPFAMADEVDGNDSIVHAFSPRPASQVVSDVLDESDIVRIFPSLSECKPVPSRKGSDVVRIFESGPDGVKRLADTSGVVRVTQDEEDNDDTTKACDSDAVQAVGPALSDRSGFVRVNSKSDSPADSCHHALGTLRKDIAEGSLRHLRASQSDRVNQGNPGNMRYSSSNNQLKSPAGSLTGPGASQFSYISKPGTPRESFVSATNPTTADSERTRPRPVRTETKSYIQTVEDTDVDDDEVFSLGIDARVLCGSDLSHLCHHDPQSCQHTSETTPVRDLLLPRPASGMCEPIKNRSSPYSPALLFSEMSFGDRQNTRKRLSFEEDEGAPAKCPFKLPLFTQHGVLNLPASSSNLPSPSYQYKSVSPTLPCQKQVFTYPHVTGGSPDYEANTGHSFSNDGHAKLPEKPASSMCRSPVSETMKILEQVSSKHAQRPSSPRARIRSDGDDRGQTPTPRPRGQTFSYGKRRRLNSSFSGDDEDNSYGSQESLTTPREQSDEAYGDCQCSMIKKYVLQMAESAYKRIKKMDGTVEDFERFRTELATTNNLLRECIANIYSFKTICPHKSRNSSTSSSSSLPFSHRPS
ncbi:hypothetical protein Btru_056234 [Bulinus truncatus]|nr:hypothetical protein Btru_056234 [Bulinus truncatus]